jgi:hypothetical protein
MKRIRVMVSVTNEDGTSEVFVYNLDPAYSKVEFADSGGGWPLTAVAAGMAAGVPRDVWLRARGWLRIEGVVGGPELDQYQPTSPAPTEQEVDEQADQINDRRDAFLHYLKWRWAEETRAAGLSNPEVVDGLFQAGRGEFRFHARLPDGRWWEQFVTPDVVRRALEVHGDVDDVPAVVMALHAKERRPRWLGAKRAAYDVANMVASELPPRSGL